MITEQDRSNLFAQSSLLMVTGVCNRSLSCNAETKDFARLTSHPVRGWTGENKAFCSPGTQTGCCVIKVYAQSTNIFL